jgi:integrase
LICLWPLLYACSRLNPPFFWMLNPSFSIFQRQRPPRLASVATLSEAISKLVSQTNRVRFWPSRWRHWKAGDDYRLVTSTLSGPDRAIVYIIAAATGLRVSEIASLTPASFDLADLDAAAVKVSAAYSKHRRDDEVPLRRDTAAAVASFTKGRPATARLFPMPERTSDMLHADLSRARDAWLRESATAEECQERFASNFLRDRDSSDRVVDFHALRGTFITRLARSNVAPAVAKSLARHSTIMLTIDHYTHMAIGDGRSALERLPALLPDEPTAEQAEMKATGTDGDAHMVAPVQARSGFLTLKGANSRERRGLDIGGRNSAQWPGIADTCGQALTPVEEDGGVAQSVEQRTFNA